MPEIKRFCCPNPQCGVRIKLEYHPSFSEKNVGITCPICKQKSPFNDWKEYVEPQQPKPSVQPQASQSRSSRPKPQPQPKPQMRTDEDKTELGNVVHQMNASQSQRQMPKDDEKTDLVNLGQKYTIGRLLLPGCTQPVQLKIGSNIIGRKANSSTATILVDDPSRMMSRTHFYINVRQSVTGMFHSFYLTPGAKNPTFLNGNKVDPDDKYFLNDGDRIRIGDVEIKFEK